MNKQELERRQQFLMRQGRALIRAENDEKIRRVLVKIRGHYEGRISKEIDPVLSQKLACVTWLIEN